MCQDTKHIFQAAHTRGICGLVEVTLRPNACSTRRHRAHLLCKIFVGSSASTLPRDHSIIAFSSRLQVSSEAIKPLVKMRQQQCHVSAETVEKW
jgi:hypothetical protein